MAVYLNWISHKNYSNSNDRSCFLKVENKEVLTKLSNFLQTETMLVISSTFTQKINVISLDMLFGYNNI